MHRIYYDWGWKTYFFFNPITNSDPKEVYLVRRKKKCDCIITSHTHTHAKPDDPSVVNIAPAHAHADAVVSSHLYTIRVYEIIRALICERDASFINIHAVFTTYMV